MALADATVVVIGAGASGIVAARSLRERGCGKVIVLEARDRVGARARPLCAMPCSSPALPRWQLTHVTDRRTHLQHGVG
jgi:cation diffusion facilitator CzcD-associated flavoprotein CzcO